MNNGNRLKHGSPTCCWSKKSSAALEALGRSRGGLTTKIHVRCEATGRLITFLLTPGYESDITLAEDLMETGSILRRSDHLRFHPKRLVADQGYSSRAFCNYLHQRNIRCTIPYRANEHHKGTFNKQIYHKRNLVECLINCLKQFRRIATRYEKRAANFYAMITPVSILLFSDFAYRPYGHRFDFIVNIFI